MLVTAKLDPTFITAAFNKSRFYMFSKREPMDSGAKELGRDMYNEKVGQAA